MDSARDLRVRCQSVLAPVGVRCSRADRVRMVREAQIKADIVADALAKNFKSILLMTRRREAPAQVAKRLHAACFKNVQAQGDGPLAQLR